jgi:hypothetical protein
MPFVLLLALAFSGLSAKVSSATTPTNALSANHVLMIDRCFTRVAGGKATLTIGPLQATGDTYNGDYAMKVAPYFFKNQKGKLAIVVPADSIETASKGVAVKITGTATDAADGETRQIDAIATPSDGRRGTLRLWFVADGRRMNFDTRYQIIARP